MLAGRALETNGYRRAVRDLHERHRGTGGAQLALVGHPTARVSRFQIVAWRKNIALAALELGLGIAVGSAAAAREVH